MPINNTTEITDNLGQDIVNSLPKVGNGTHAIAVGFNSDKDLVELEKILKRVFNKGNEELADNISKAVQASGDKQQTQIKEQTDAVNKLYEEIHTANEQTRKKEERANKESKENSYQRTTTFLKQVAKGFGDISKDYFSAVAKMGNVFRDIESTGVYVNKSFDEVVINASKAGYTIEDFTANMSKNSKMFTQLNSLYNDGISTYSKILEGLKDDKNKFKNSLLLSNKERMEVANSLVNNLSPSVIREMSEEELIKRTRETATWMKKLSYEVGVSVDQIAQINDKRAATARMEVYRQRNNDLYTAMTSVGMTDDMIDFLISGGRLGSVETRAAFMGNPALQSMLPALMSIAQRGGSADEFTNLLMENKDAIYENLALQDLRGRDTNIYTASGVSTIFQSLAFGMREYLERASKITTFEPEVGNIEREDTNNAIEQIEALSQNTSAIQNLQTLLESGGDNGIYSTLSKVNIGLDLVKNGMTNLAEALEKYDLNGFTSGIMITAGEKLGVAAGNKIADIVSKFLGDKFESGFSGTVKDVLAYEGGKKLFTKTVAGGGVPATVGKMGPVGAAILSTASAVINTGEIQDYYAQLHPELSKKEQTKKVADDYSMQGIDGSGSWWDPARIIPSILGFGGRLLREDKGLYNKTVSTLEKRGVPKDIAEKVSHLPQTKYYGTDELNEHIARAWPEYAEIINSTFNGTYSNNAENTTSLNASKSEINNTALAKGNTINETVSNNMSIMSSKQDESNKLLNEILSQFRKANTMTEKAYTDKQITPIHPVNATALY